VAEAQASFGKFSQRITRTKRLVFDHASRIADPMWQINDNGVTIVSQTNMVYVLFQLVKAEYHQKNRFTPVVFPQRVAAMQHGEI
jgi:hypothetical protein